MKSPEILTDMLSFLALNDQQIGPKRKIAQKCNTCPKNAANFDLVTASGLRRLCQSHYRRFTYILEGIPNHDETPIVGQQYCCARHFFC